ncbi:MAG: hypothetical protein ACEQSF_00450 [Solirubrobacteraceae bacterium]
MANKFLLPVFLILIISFIANYIVIDERMSYFKNENLIHSIAMALSLIGMLVAIIYYKINNINSAIDKRRKELN